MNRAGKFRRVAAALILGSSLCGSRFPAVAQSTEASSSGTVTLDYRELKSELNSWGLDTSFETTPFKAEPQFGGRKVVRGSWRLGNDTAQSMRWIWDNLEGKLYLDLNRNQDLTDDQHGVFTCSEGTSRSKHHQTFSDVRLTFKTPMGAHPALGNISLYNYSGGQLFASFAPRSYWAGRLSNRGREWEVGFVDNVTAKVGSPESGYLVLRRWETRDEEFDLQEGSLAGFPFCRKVFFGKQFYNVSCVYTQQNGAPKYQLTFQEQPVDLGELRLTGQYIKRALLQLQGQGGANATVVLDTPDSVVRIPVGNYDSLIQVSLRQAGVEAYRQVNRYGAPSGKPFVVATNQTAALAVGGPLTNSVQVTRRSHALNLSYQLVGAGGDPYQLRGARKQPEFAIYQDSKKIDSGKFEFG